MPGTSASQTIWFIASVLVAATVAGTLIGVVVIVTQGLNDRGNAVSGSLGTDVEIVNDPQMVPYNTTTDILTIYAKNIGKTTLNKDTNSILVLINGTYTIPATVTIIGGGEWTPGKVAIINVTVPDLLQNVDYRMEVFVSDIKTSATASDPLDFRIKI